MKLKLAIAFAVLFLASIVRADGIQTAYGEVFIPDGSVVTAISYTGFPSVNNTGLATVSFTFADGTGSASTQGFLGSTYGTIDFTTAVSDLSLVWIAGDTIGFSDNTSNTSYGFNGEDFGFGTLTFTGSGITQVVWLSTDVASGIDSMTYTLDSASVPEPSSLLLLGMGLAALIGLKLKA